MLRALFFQELRRSWLAHAGLFAAIFGTIALVDHVPSRESFSSPADESYLGHLLLTGLILSGLISGERCFSTAFKEGRYSFLLTLPRPRGGIWLAYLGGRLTGALAALPIFLLPGPSLLRWLSSRGWLFLLAALSGYLVYFLGSAALALALRKEILVYLVGVPLLTGLLGFVSVHASYGFISDGASISDGFIPYGFFGIEWQPSAFHETPRFLKDFSYGSLLLALVWTAVSLRAFCRGELHLARRTAQTLIEAGLASATFVGLALMTYSSSTLAALRDEWKPAAPDGVWFPYQAGTRLLSADDRFLVIRQQLRERPLFTRLAVVNLKSGSMTGWMEQPGIYQISWSASEAVLNVLVANNTPSDCLGIPCTGSTSWYRLSPDLRVLSTRDLPGTGFFHHFGGGLLLVTRKWNVGRVYRLSDRDDSFREILTSELGDDAPWWREGDSLAAWSLDRGAVVVFPRAASLQAWWLDQKGQIHHEESVSRRSGENYYLVGYRFLSSQEVKAEAIRRAIPFPSKGSEIWEPVLPNAAGPFDFGSRQFYLRSRQGTAGIWKHDTQQGSWTQILPELQIGDSRHVMNLLTAESPMEHEGSGVPFARLDVDIPTWTWAAAVAKEGRERLFLYDDQLGRSIPNTVACGPGEEGRTSLEQVQGLEGLLVRFACWDEGALLRYWLLELIPGSGQVGYLALHSAIVQPMLFDHWIYLDPDGISVWVSRTGEVWRVGPGRKPLRLNPPAGKG